VIQFGDGSHNTAYEFDDDYVVGQLRKLGPRKPDSAVLMTGTGMPTIGAISQVRTKLNV
jgi:hypothetical protein